MMITRQYPLPKEPGLFKLALPRAMHGFVCLAIIQADGEAHLLMREPAEVTARDPWSFALRETGQEIFQEELRYGCAYLGTAQINGKPLHLFGPATRPEGGKKR